MFEKFADWLITKAQKTPYYHLAGYMERFWLVPYKEAGSLGADGTGSVSFWRRPFAWLLQNKDIAVRVHHILKSDDDRALHTHPWNYWSVILKGGYWEVTAEYDAGGFFKRLNRKWYGPGSFIRRSSTSLHRLEIEEGSSCWTLFITFKYKHSWGFVANLDNLIHYKKYLSKDDPTKKRS